MKFDLWMDPTGSTMDLYREVQALDNRGLLIEQMRLIYGGRQLVQDPNVGIGECDIVNGSIVHLILRLFGKPVIYLFSPSEIEVSVKLSLIPEWNISAIYPVVPIKSPTAHSNEEVTWRVRVHPNGDLTELNTGLDVTYLFWEAQYVLSFCISLEALMLRLDYSECSTNPVFPLSPPSSPGHCLEYSKVQNIERFIPNDATLDDANSVLLVTEKITPYLDSALKALGLHTEARTSFITYVVGLNK